MTKRFDGIEIALLAAAPILLVLSILASIAQGALFQKVGATGILHYLLPGAAFFGAYVLAANAGFPLALRMFLSVLYLAIFLFGAVVVLVITGLELV